MKIGKTRSISEVPKRKSGGGAKPGLGKYQPMYEAAGALKPGESLPVEFETRKEARLLQAALGATRRAGATPTRALLRGVRTRRDGATVWLYKDAQ